MSPGCTWGALLLTALLLQPALSSPDFRVGGQLAVRLPGAYQPGFIERTTVLEPAGKRQPRFAAAVSVEAGTGGGYLCSLVVLLANVTIWASDRPDQELMAPAVCQLELTADGQLRLTDGARTIGWWSGTAGQGAKALHLDSRTGNLRLLDDKNHTVWQSFDKPTDKLLPGQWLRLPAYFAVSPAKTSSVLYTVELDSDKIAAYIYFGQRKYSYWELAPGSNQAMAFAGMDESGLTMYDRRRRPVARISPAVNKGPVRFLALGDDGGLGLYVYDGRHGEFTPSYEALAFCDLPLPCGVLGVCSRSGSCSDFAARGVRPTQGGTLCNATATGPGAHDMVEVRGVTTVLKADSPVTNVTVRQCVDLCLSGCSCAAVLHVKDDAGADRGVCSLYELTAGAREVIGGRDGQRHSYWVKVLKESKRNCREDEEDYGASNEALTKILIVFGVVDVMGLLLFGGLCVYFISLRGSAADKHVCEEDGEAAGHDRGAAEPDRNANNNGAVQDS
ncbi:putative receptor protein kinase ZmPK1 [Hordeum vulgare]|nr:putative receptor protein kinase ZmPK1 [Hordeum vulgare]